MLVLGNKIDRPEAVSEGGLRGAFALDGQTTGKVSTSVLVLVLLSGCVLSKRVHLCKTGCVCVSCLL